jgi:DNA-binding MarR family transcriptional regulator
LDRVADSKSGNVIAFPTAEPACRREVGIHDEGFCRSLERLDTWKRTHMPVLDMPQGTEVLIWLLKGGTRPRPLKDLYRSSRFSEPTVHAALRALVEEQMIAIVRNPEDLRVHTVHLTPKLVARVREYFDRLRECAAVGADDRPA